MSVSLNVALIAPAAEISAAQKATPTATRLTKAAQDFESMLLASLWKSMHQSFGPNDEAEAGTNNLDDIATQALCSGIAAGGGLGIAKMLLRHLTAGGSAGLSGGAGSDSPDARLISRSRSSSLGRPASWSTNTSECCDGISNLLPHVLQTTSSSRRRR